MTTFSDREWRAFWMKYGELSEQEGEVLDRLTELRELAEEKGWEVVVTVEQRPFGAKPGYVPYLGLRPKEPSGVWALKSFATAKELIDRFPKWEDVEELSRAKR